MPARRRTVPRSRLNQAVKAGRKALRQAEKRIPTDLRRQINRSIADGQKTFNAVLKDIRTRVSKATAPGEMDRALRRFGDLSKQVEGLARNLTARAASATGTASARRPATRRTAARPAAKPRATARKPATRKTATRRTTSRRKASPAVVTAPPAVPEAPAEPMA
ncbi:MAG TPA: hypothetical protein VGV88_09650 [Candidatus Dormibacteraeota bacterium]|nr:hypothetical protein [Candidatus Dormibacteraeota bacterium]